MNNDVIKLGINAFSLYPGKIGGAEQYLRNIVSKLTTLNNIHTHIFLNDTARDTFEENDNLSIHYLSSTIHLESQLSNYIKLYELDVWFCPFFHLIPDDCKIPSITAIFDIQQEYFAENFDKIVLKDRRALTRQTLAKTDEILTISEFSKKTLIEKFDVNPSKISVTYLDADDSFSKELDADLLKKTKAKFDKDYIFFPANFWPHKNHANLLKGFAMAIDKYKLNNLELVFTGAKERETQVVEEIIDSEDLRDKVKYLGYIPQEEMPYIFACANMLAFPSLFEGFGIPLIEAMSTEIPIICSKSSCLPEVAENSAIYFDANSPKEICEAIYKVYSDENLRKNLIEEGKKRRDFFSWEKCTSETVEHIKKLYKPREKQQSKLSEKPLVSIITPSYNQGQFIRETIESVLNQSYDNIEYIVMDGGSTDETVSILKEYDDRITWVSEKDGGQADAVNKGIRVAKGEIIGWLNSDDTYYPDAVKRAVEVLKKFPDVEMMYGEGMYIDTESNETERYETKPFTREKLAEECFICQPTAFFTKNIVQKAGMLNADLQLCMDYELWMRIGKITEVLYIPEYLATSRMYIDNKTSSRRDEVYSECCREIKRHYGYVPHGWINGYTYHVLSLNPQKTFKMTYAKLFLKYNFNNFKYIAFCAKKYMRRRHMAKLALNETAPAVTTRYPDGWISKTYIETFDNSENCENLHLSLKHFLPMKENLVLKVYANDNFIEDIVFNTHCNIEKTIPLNNISDESVEIKIIASETYNPAKADKKSADNRDLAVLINEIHIK